jgi:uncharacterized membrane protein
LAISAYVKAAGIGAVAGLRTMTAPAVTLAAQDSPWRGAGRLLAFGEYIGDKLPFTPSRLSPPALIARAVSGGWCGGAVAARLGASRLAGIGCGVAGSVAGAWAGYALRSFLTKTKGIPDTGIALAEDALAVWGARLATKAPG